MSKIVRMTLTYDDGSGKTIYRSDTKWLFVAMSEDGFKQLSLSGNDKDDAYLLRILENAVIQTMNKTNKYGTNDEEPDAEALTMAIKAKHGLGREE